MTKMEIVTAALTYLGGSAAVIAILGYKLWRLLKADGISDTLNQSALALIEVHRQKAVDAEARAEKLAEQLDITQKERNELASKVGELSATVVHLTEKVEDLEDMIKELKQLVHGRVNVQTDSGANV